MGNLRGVGVQLGVMAIAIGLTVAARRAAGGRPEDNSSPESGTQANGQVRTIVAERPSAGEAGHGEPLSLEGQSDDEVVRLMESQPARVMAAIDVLEDRSRAVTLAGRCARELQGPCFDLLVAWMTRISRIPASQRIQEDVMMEVAIYIPLIERWRRLDQDACIAFARDMGGDQDSLQAKKALAALLPGETRVKVVGEFPVEERLLLLQPTIGRLFYEAPEAALKTLVELPDSPDRTQMVTDLVTKWASNEDIYGMRTPEPRPAVDHVMQISDPTLRADVLRTTVTRWAVTNPAQAEKWLRTLSEGQDRDAAIQGITNVLKIYNHSSALTWAASISDPDVRAKVQGRLQK